MKEFLFQLGLELLAEARDWVEARLLTDSPDVAALRAEVERLTERERFQGELHREAVASFVAEKARAERLGRAHDEACARTSAEKARADAAEQSLRASDACLLDARKSRDDYAALHRASAAALAATRAVAERCLRDCPTETLSKRGKALRAALDAAPAAVAPASTEPPTDAEIDGWWDALPAAEQVTYSVSCRRRLVRHFLASHPPLPAPGLRAAAERWRVEVTEVAPRHFRTTFHVGVQSFTLADSDDAEEGEAHCWFIAQQFRAAIARALSATWPDRETLGRAMWAAYTQPLTAKWENGSSALHEHYKDIGARFWTLLTAQPPAADSLEAPPTNKVDFHEETARRTFGLPADSVVTKKQRATAKWSNFAAAYCPSALVAEDDEERKSPIPAEELAKLCGVPVGKSSCILPRAHSVEIAHESKYQFICTHCRELTHNNDGGADEFPSACSKCWTLLTEKKEQQGRAASADRLESMTLKEFLPYLKGRWLMCVNTAARHPDKRWRDFSSARADKYEKAWFSLRELGLIPHEMCLHP